MTYLLLESFGLRYLDQRNWEGSIPHAMLSMGPRNMYDLPFTSCPLATRYQNVPGNNIHRPGTAGTRSSRRVCRNPGSSSLGPLRPSPLRKRTPSRTHGSCAAANAYQHGSRLSKQEVSAPQAVAPRPRSPISRTSYTMPNGGQPLSARRTWSHHPSTWSLHSPRLEMHACTKP